MYPPFPQELAHHYCISLISRLDCGRDASLCQISRESIERTNQGVMIGTLVCWDKVLCKRVILYAVSGNGKVLRLKNPHSCEIVVPSIVSADDISRALEEHDKEIHHLTDKINSLTGLPHRLEERKALIKKRTSLTDISLRRVFDLYHFTRFDGSVISLNDIISKHGGRLPPTGTGDCCAPKLLSYAFAHDLQLVSMDEVYYGQDTKNRKNKCSYAPCDDRCGYILPHILGLEILYRDSDIIVVNKESGLLSVPGRGADKEDSVETRVRMLFPHTIKQPAVHRLDMETSGVLVLAFNKEAHRDLNRQFAEGLVNKKYIALLGGILHGIPHGRVELKTILDINNRPRQIVDNENGKLGITIWKKTGVKDYCNCKTGETVKATVIEFMPVTGRTHQLRLAASVSREQGGMGLPIIGDSLYGNKKDGERLMLHSFFIEFHHPVSGKKITIETGFPLT